MLLHPTYFPNIAHFVAILTSDNLVFEVCDNYQKQTYRNRSEIYGANGKLVLSVPVSYTQKLRQQSKDVQISSTDNWQLQHLKSLDSAYRMSPFYEFYIDDLMPIFETQFKYLLDLNLKCFELISEALELNKSYTLSEEFIVPDNSSNDYRHLVNAKKHTNFQFNKYTQVFMDKHGYFPNLSILDLLFNEGPNTLNYLEAQIPKL
ncbi:WbqC family protein [uncultured Winogradskyella sp.]|uniref:WbqC family protein n=1 Tax=uncultured Winogradskyella sp. TaxID=395353 RepID=UPI002621BBDF|nr:WbqC family protein [uncultured Winogradskyella sp.]